MAERGTIASGIGLAAFVIEVGDKILKLKSFIDSIKEAPEEVDWLIMQMNILHLLLSNSGTNKTDIVDANIADRSHQLCL